MLTTEDLMRMRNMTFADISPEEIPDISELEIDVTQSKREKILKMLESGRNPYFIKNGKTIIKMGYASTNRTIEDAFESLVTMNHDTDLRYI